VEEVVSELEQMVREADEIIEDAAKRGLVIDPAALKRLFREGVQRSLLSRAAPVPAPPPGGAPTDVREHPVRICEQCIRLEGAMCNNPACVFCRRTMAEVGAYLDALLIRPVIDGERMPAAAPPVPPGEDAACDYHPGTEPHHHCKTCGEAVWHAETPHECPPAFAPAPGEDASPAKPRPCDDCGAEVNGPVPSRVGAGVYECPKCQRRQTDLAAAFARPAILRSLPPEELAKVTPISEDEIREALAKGAEARWRAMNPGNHGRPPAAAPSRSGAPAPTHTLPPGTAIPTRGCIRCGHAYAAHARGPYKCTECDCAGYVDDPDAPCLCCGRAFAKHPVASCAPGFQAPAVYYCENARCPWRSYAKPCERRCPACGAQVWKDGSAGHRDRPSLPVRRALSSMAGLDAASERLGDPEMDDAFTQPSPEGAPASPGKDGGGA
jgi:hypothetical protein